MIRTIIKKIIAAAAAASLAAALPICAGAQDVPAYNLPSIDIKKGDTVTASVYANADGYSGLHLTFDYDESALSYSSQETYIGHGDSYDKDGELNWNVMFSADGSNLKFDDKIAEITFTALTDITDSKIKVSIVDSYGVGEENGDLPDIDFKTHGKITLSSNGVFGLVGDVNGDEEVDSVDALAILRASAQIDVIPFPRSAAADVNRDGSIDSTDSLLTLRHSVSLDTPGIKFGAPSVYTRDSADYYFGRQE